MAKYTVTCFKDGDLKIKKGDIVEVKGHLRKGKILADSITNPAGSGDVCDCGPPVSTPDTTSEQKPGKVAARKAEIKAEWVEKKGEVGEVRRSSEFVEFELITQ
jgi:hypothetical protein